ncbi:MAG: low specificity L-threonine aldolase [Rhodospirillaceae bacterium]|jgi:threonine aldolase|nr:low specificity L-threonine aldolase [Rhodospirillaceae bacterium]MBT4688315.1 low specificity L-threonine aldolase [Rhodospirillaceae bacterium]MBT5080027.1 low specificity L-threonine aldolase [Rhodospirillaceae bacterium]MBT5525616.1 low specificity L-threonine aldolase [Rhodospirillaceae bacterium]MBT5880375.1 low specificity L-threonine aldolase [Rhodospirillaceae bacterium]
MNFSSDNASGVAPQIMAALAAANEGHAMAYGADPITKAAEAAFTDLFGRELAVFPVATGTAANALALSALTPPWGQIYCHRNAHIEEDEAGAPELFSGGAKLALLDGDGGKIEPETLATAIAGAGFGVQHHSQPSALSLTQATEAGTIYDLDEIAALSGIAHNAGLSVHMDGARFANAVAHLGCSPAAATWQAGVDVLSFGATKNGAMAAEAVVFFDPDMAEDFLYRRKRGGHLFSKMRYLSAQLVAYLQDDLWLENARHANACAQTLSQGLAALDGAHLVHPVQANEIFVTLPERVLNALKTASVGFHSWGNEGLSRFVCAFNTDAADVERTLKIAQAAI